MHSRKLLKRLTFHIFAYTLLCNMEIMHLETLNLMHNTLKFWIPLSKACSSIILVSKSSQIEREISTPRKSGFQLLNNVIHLTHFQVSRFDLRKWSNDCFWILGLFTSFEAVKKDLQKEIYMLKRNLFKMWRKVKKNAFDFCYSYWNEFS